MYFNSHAGCSAPAAGSTSLIPRSSLLSPLIRRSCPVSFNKMQVAGIESWRDLLISRRQLRNLTTRLSNLPGLPLDILVDCSQVYNQSTLKRKDPDQLDLVGTTEDKGKEHTPLCTTSTSIFLPRTIIDNLLSNSSWIEPQA